MDDVAGFLLGTIQFGNSASFDPARVAVVRGRVLNASGEALPNVRLGVKDHDEYGYTLSRADGRFDLVVSGGLSLILVMEKPGFVTAHRDVETVAQQFQVVEDVRLAPLDVASTVVQFGAAQPRMHLASTVTDGAGTRRAGIYFPSSLGAAVRDENGTLVQLPRSVTVRATELTVGDKPTLMPARLPASTAYTYAVELTADGVSSTQEISFSKPVYLYVDDLLGFPPGAVIPNGYYNRKTGQWEAVEDGVVIRITGVDPAGQAVLEAPAAMLDPAANDPHYITPEERITLANAYPVGQTLWRAPVRHFSAYDLNNSLGCVNENSATKPCEEPNQDGPVVAETDDKPECEAGSIIECQNQTLSESVPVSGSPYRLVYRSDRVPGRRDLRSIKVSIDPARVPSYALQTNDANCAAQGESKTIVTAVVAGRVLEQAGECVYDASARRYVVTFVWDGRDPYGRPLQGRQAGYVKFEHEYPVINVYTSGGRGSSFSMFATGLNTTFVEGRSRVRRAQRFPITVEYWTPGPTSMGGWEFDARHTYVPGAKMLLYGDGRRSQASLRFGGYSISTIATIPTKSSAATLATAIAPDGTLYAVSPERIYRVDGDGTTTAIAGGGNIDPPWTDAGGVDAASVRFVAMESGGSPLRDILAVPDGSFYFGYANRIHRLWSTDGGRTYRVRTLWGNGNAAMTGDGLYAADPSTGLPNPAVAFSKPSSLALGPDGSLFVLHYNRLRQIDPSGIVRSVNNVSATFNSTAGTVRGSKLLMGPDGSLYFTALCAAKRLRPDPSAAGSKTYPLAPELVAGTGTCPTPSAPYTEGAKATATPVGDIVGLAWLPDGGLLMGDYTQRTLHVRWPDGSVSDVAGNGELGFSGDGGPATSAAMGQIVGAPSVGPDGSIYVPTYWYASPSNVNFRIRRLTPRTPAYDGGDISIADESGSEIFVFDRTGRHLATMNGANGALVRGFCYDTSGRLTRIAECASAAAYSCESGLGWTCSGPTTTIERDSSSGFPSAIISGPAASRNVVGQDSLGQGYLGWIQTQAGERYGFVYDSAPGREGLLTQFIEPRGTGDIRAATHVLQYDDRGRLRVDRSPSGGAKTLARVETPTDTTVTVTTSLAQTTSYRTVQSETTPDGKTVAWTKRGDKKRVTTFPDSTSQTTQLLKNGSTVVVSPDGTVATTSISGDPRFGLQSPVPSVTITTPEGRSYAVKEARTAEPASEPDPLRKTRLTTTTTATWTSGTKQVTSTTSSVWSRASAESLEATATTTSAGGRQVTSQLDGLGRPVTVAAPGRHPIVLSYDDFGRITNVTQSTRHWTIAYDDGSRRATLTGPAAQSATVEFDNAGRPVTVDLPGGRRAGEAWYADGEPRTVSPPGRGAHGFGFDDATGLVSRYTPPSLDDGANWPSVIVSDLDERPRQGLLGVQARPHTTNGMQTMIPRPANSPRSRT